MKNKKIAIIGHFGGNKDFFDGQTVKTKIIYEELLKIKQNEIICVDTFYKSEKPMKLFWASLQALVVTNDVVVLLSGNGMRLYFPVLYLCSKLFHKNVFHDVIGGNLDGYVEKYPLFKRYLNSFKVNWVETELLKKKLLKLGINNCEVIPNFKRLYINYDIDESVAIEPFRFCTFSRVMKEKGIEDAIEAIRSINIKERRIICTLDIYGVIDNGYKEEFVKLMNEVPEYISYKGVVPYSDSVNAIKDSYALLFPTHWYGEGFPGTIIDAFSAGVPVICTDWNSNSEIVQNDYNGVVYSGAGKELAEAIMHLINKKDNIKEMKKNCITSALKYQPDKYVSMICDYINSI